MSTRNLWTREELILTLSLYFQLPFGRLNKNTREVKDLANLIGRTDNSVALRLVNFAACDPYILATGRHGMSSGVGVCMPYWEEFADRREELFFEAERIEAELLRQPIEKHLRIEDSLGTGIDRFAVVKQRVNQNVFRTMVLNNYNERCAVTGIAVPELLVASHIIPWAENEKERLNPENGICLSALYDKAFDQGFIGVDSHYEIILAEKLRRYSDCDFYGKHFACVDHQPLMMPEEHVPNPLFLEWHRDCVFDK